MPKQTEPVRSFRRLPFNSPVESGLRTLCILYEAYPAEYDLQRLVFFDYLLVHSGDAPDGPVSLHPPTPFRSNEFLVRRRLIESGVRLLLSRDLIHVRAADTGFVYRVSDVAASFVSALQTPYTQSLRERATWVVASFSNTTDDQLSEFFNQNLDRWGSEFEVITGWDDEEDVAQ
jgi:hypothetical protein